MGFSDATTFISYLNKLGMITFYGPSIMAGLAQIKHLPTEFSDHMRSILFSNEFPYNYKPYFMWTNEYKEWSKKETIGECAEFYNNEKGWIFLQGDKITQGRLWGGCIEVLEFLKSTKYWPEEDFWNDKILFFETSEEKPLLHIVGYMLRNYGIQGIFNRVKGVIFGRPKDYSNDEKKILNNIVLSIIKNEFKSKGLPIVMNVDFRRNLVPGCVPSGIRSFTFSSSVGTSISSPQT
jgi:muramoyltetrapeptide carboxypeptidase LdcA involved in peptidoglycan recycling